MTDALKTQFRGGKNAHKTLYSNAVDKVITLAESRKDMEFLNLRRYATERICAAMGVPRIILGYTEGINYTNAETQMAKYIENTIRPLERFLEEVFTRLIALSDPSLSLRIVDNHSDGIAERTESVSRLVDRGVITRNEAREEIGYSRSDEEEADTLVVSGVVGRLEDIVARPRAQSVSDDPA